MEEALKAMARIAEDILDRLHDAEEQAQHWQDVAGRQAMRAGDLERKLMAATNQPNGSEA